MKQRIPAVMTQRLLSLESFWLGGGRPDIKMRVNTKEFMAAFSPLVCDITRDDEAGKAAANSKFAAKEDGELS